jgi:hypothetical protein
MVNFRFSLISFSAIIILIRFLIAMSTPAP